MSKIKYVAAHYGLTRETLHNCFYGKTQAARAVHPEQRLLTEEQRESVGEWVGGRGTLSYLPKPKELRRTTVQILNNYPEGPHCDRAGITTSAAS